jgi:hypothetical protein
MTSGAQERCFKGRRRRCGPAPGRLRPDFLVVGGKMSITSPDADVIRIFFSTDNHLGYNEKDPVRGDDSFIAFEEVLEKCIEAKVSYSRTKMSAIYIWTM